MKMLKKSIFIFVSIFIGTSLAQVSAQEVRVITNNQLTQTIQTEEKDTARLREISASDLEKIPSLRDRFEKTNETYSDPAVISEYLQEILTKDELDISPEARYWLEWKRDPDTYIPEYMTLHDTTIVNPLFTTPIFKGGLIPKNFTLEDKDFLARHFYQYHFYQPDTTLFQEEVLKANLQQSAYDYVRINHPGYFHYSLQDLPTDVVKANEIQKTTFEAPDMIKVQNEGNTVFDDVDAPVRFIPARRYWTSSFQSSVQFAQNYISPNWHTGGTSALNLTNRQYFVYNYNKNKVQLANELEWRTNFYTAPKDTLRDYKIGEDVLRLHTTFGYKAFQKWYYSLDATFKTQLFTNYAENTTNKLAGILAPLNVNVGIGMKYDLNKTFASNKYKRLILAANIAPLALDYKYSIDKDMDLARHGFTNIDPETGKIKNTQIGFGPTVNATMNFQINKNVNWFSRFYYYTNYHKINIEFENRLNMTISRFFSTTITLNTRYDDMVAKREDFNTKIQLNELLSFGFNYKW